MRRCTASVIALFALTACAGDNPQRATRSAANGDAAAPGDDSGGANHPFYDAAPFGGDSNVAGPGADAGNPPYGNDDAGAASDAAYLSDGSLSCASYLGAGTPASAWVYADANGKLGYKAANAQGDRIMDFSYAGYMGGGVAIPLVAVTQMVNPSGGDDTTAIQTAIDKVSIAPPQNGIRGAVLLAPGAFNVGGVLAISASGVVLRGSGSDVNGTRIVATGPARQLMRVHGSGGAAAVAGATAASITDAYVPSGATSFHVNDASKIAVGDDVFVGRPVTSAWIKFMGMDQLSRNGLPQTWLLAGTVLNWERTITSVMGNAVAIDVPLSDSLDAMYVSPPGGSVVKFSHPGRITQVGIEDIRFESPARAAGQEFAFVRFDAVADGWIRRVAVHNFTNGVWLGPGVKRITVEDTAMTHDATAYFTSAAPFDFWNEGSQTLVQRSSSTGGNKIWYYATQVATQGPNVLMGFTASGMNSHVTAHQRWATGLLVDGANVQGGISLGNNLALGNGEGWSMGWGVVWNATSDVLVEAPPGAMNWSIGGTGATPSGTNLGTYESSNVPVVPKSLYLAQLCSRLGPRAVTAIGN